MKGKNSRRAVSLSMLLICQLLISSAAPIVSAFLESYLKVAAVKLIYALSFVVPYIIWKKTVKPVGVSYKKHDLCEYKKPAFFVAFAAIVAFLQMNIVLLELLGVSSISSGGGVFDGVFGFFFSLVMYAFIPAVSEEIFSRGVVMRAAGGGMRAAILSGVLFGVCHFNPYQLIYAAGAGVVLSVLYLYTDDIRLSVYLHLTVNTVVLILSYLAQVCSVGVYVALECLCWLTVLGLGVYYSFVILRDHHRSLNERTKQVMRIKSDIDSSEILSPAMVVVYVAIILATVLRFV